MLYFFAIVVLFYFALAHKFTNIPGFNDKKKFIAFIILTYIASFAYMLGSDTPEYVYFYNHLVPISKLSSNIIEQYRYQPGFTIFCSIIKSISDNYLLFQIIHACLVNYVVFRFCNRYSCNPYISLLAYILINYLEFNFEIQRESLAVVCGLMAYEFYDRRKYIWAILCFFIAYYFHFSAIVLLLIPLCLSIKPTKRNTILLVSFAALAPWGWKAIPNADLFLAFSTDSTFYSGYINQELNTSYNMYYYISFYIMNMCIPLVIIWILRDKQPFYTNLVLIFILFKMLSLFSYGFYRFSNYFVCFYWIALADCLPYVCRRYNLKKPAIYALVLLVVCYTNQTKLTWFEDETGKYIYQRYFPYEDVIFGKDKY